MAIIISILLSFFVVVVAAVVIVYIILIWLVLSDTHTNTNTLAFTKPKFKFTKISTHMQMIVNDLEIIKQPQNISEEKCDFKSNMWFSCWMYFIFSSYLHVIRCVFSCSLSLMCIPFTLFPIPFIYKKC